LERFGRRFTPLTAVLSMLSLPAKILEELSEIPRRDWEALMERFFRRLVERAPSSLVRERRLPDGSMVREVGPIVWGVSFKLSQGKPSIKSFGNIKPSMLRALEGFTVAEYREPLYDLEEEDGKLRVTVELPGAVKEGIQVTGTERTLTVKAEGRGCTYFREIELPYEVEPKEAKSTYSNGLLEVVLPRKGPAPRLRGEPIKVE